MLKHVGLDLRALARAERWARLTEAFARRHVLVHRHGLVDQRFLDEVPASQLRVG
ncbi:MAG: hypothetical protein K2Q09_11595 [Phycisphaerales bacterium]|nr:hypothetical protein [Phycisphaerales bacterium]